MPTLPHNLPHIGCVSFLNSKPLIDPLLDDRSAHVHFAVPSALLDLAVVRAMVKAVSERRRRAWAATGICANLALLVWFKYANFIYGGIASSSLGWFGLPLPALAAIALPIGVSFIVFEKITYFAGYLVTEVDADARHRALASVEAQLTVEK